MRVIVDAFGGDNAPLEIIKGAAMAAREYGHEILLTGDEEQIRRVAAENGISLDKMEIIHAPDVIAMDDEPRSILKEHKECSMAEGLRQLAAGNGDAFVTAGSTGAMIMGATFIVKRIKGVSRAALAPIMPSNKGVFMLLDSGANAECRPEMLAQFAHMGSLYMEAMMEHPVTVGLINIGTEDCKGGALQQETFSLLKNSDLNFIGNVEARDIPFGTADVLVADGFTGNVVLKLMEGVTDALLKNIKGIFMTNLKTKIAALLVKPQLGGFKKKMDTSEYGGAPLLGVSKPVIKTHGNSKAASVKHAIRVAATFASAGVIEKITDAVQAENAKTEEQVGVE